jgi:hypothetical protein
MLPLSLDLTQGLQDPLYDDELFCMLAAHDVL